MSFEELIRRLDLKDKQFCLDVPLVNLYFGTIHKYYAEFSFTCLVLEQMPHYYTQALQEMRRVTRKYGVFIEPFAEANNFFGKAQLRSVDYFRYSYKCFAEFGMEPIYFTTAFPQKLRHKAGMLIVRIGSQQLE